MFDDLPYYLDENGERVYLPKSYLTAQKPSGSVLWNWTGVMVALLLLLAVVVVVCQVRA